MKLNVLSKVTLLGILCAPLLANSQAFTENFDNITSLPSGWFMTNNSAPVGVTGWTQGPSVAGGGPFDAYNGAADAFISANFNNTGATGTISNWLMAPNTTIKNGDVFTFFTRKASPDTYADRLELRLSTNGASTAAGSGTTTGDFTTLLLSINPSLVLGVYPTTWTQYSLTISGLPAPTSGRIAFRYFVTGAGSSGANSDFIGIDNVVYTPYVCPSFTMTPTGPLAGGTAGVAYSTSLTQSGALGTPNYTITGGALPPGLTLSGAGTISGTPTGTGVYNFTATVTDPSGCAGSTNYSIAITCPSNPITLSSPPLLCSNSSMYTLVEGSPAGGTYAGIGVSGGSFDPSVGTQSITYNYSDAYSCAHNSMYTLSVIAAPTVSHSTISATCDNSGILALSGGSPVGGTYSGTGVSGTNFDPSVGTQTLTYSYTDGNNCTNTATALVTVNTAPTVTQSSISATCDNAGSVALSGGSPAGGSYSGTGVSGMNFDPSVGTQTLTYSYTDGNNCTNTATVLVTVNTAPIVTQSAISAVCENGSSVVLSGGSPAGGSYSGTGVSGGNFDPSVGTQTITYTYTDGNNCSNTATTPVTVNTAPNVSFNSPVSSLCTYNNPLTLSGGLPAGGSYSGSGVSTGVMNPASAGIGSHAITYDYTDGNGCQGSAQSTIIVEACLGVDSEEIDNLLIYPNPAIDEIFIEYQNTSANEAEIMLVSNDGKVVFSSTIKDNSNFKEKLDVSNFSKGVYFIRIKTNSTLIVEKIVLN